MVKNRIETILIILFILIVFTYSILLNRSSNTTGSSTSTMSSTTTVMGAQVYGPTSEIQNISLVYPNANSTTFSCSRNNDCINVHTQYCFNNLASQQACINRNYSDTYNSYYNRFLSKSAVVCLAVIVHASAICTCINQGCSLVYNRTG